MLHIIRVGALDGEMLDIELSNGSLILLSLSSLVRRNRDFLKLRETGRLLSPITDGVSVKWREGPSLGLEDIFLLLREKGTEERPAEGVK